MTDHGPSRTQEVLAVTQGDTEAAGTSHAMSVNSVLVICTRNRPGDLANALRYVHEASPKLPVLVADASTVPLA